VADGEVKNINVEGREIRIGVPAEKLAAVAAMIPMGRMGTIDEGAGSIYMFCIPESNYVTGQTIICGGGRGGF
jgi:3-oxoacyl-[acyl-carrier protein] reductase